MTPEAWWALPMPESELLQLAARTSVGLVVRRRLADDEECLAPTLLAEDECALFDIEAQELRYVLGSGASCEKWAPEAEFSPWTAMAASMGWTASLP